MVFPPCLAEDGHFRAAWQAPQFIVDTCARWLDSMDHFGSIATILWNRLAPERAGGYPWTAMGDDGVSALKVR